MKPKQCKVHQQQKSTMYVCIPKKIREFLGIKKGDKMQVDQKDQKIIYEKVKENG